MKLNRRGTVRLFLLLPMLVVFGTSRADTPLSGKSDPAPVSTAALVPVVVRVQGLALGGSFQLTRGGTPIVAISNDPYTFAELADSGTALNLQVSSQPLGQSCAISELAPTAVPTDSSPIFVRCRSVPSARVTMPTTLPNNPLSVMLGASAIRPAAYPGIAYESRPGVLGGIFPYEFRLNAVTLNGTPLPTSSVSIDFRRGTLRFTPASEGTYALTVEVRDSASTQKVLMHTFTVQSMASRFLFVAPNGVNSPERGSITQPFLTPAYALSLSAPDQVIVLRKGTYSLSAGLNIEDGRAKQFVAYPDEVVLFDQGYAGHILVRIATAPSARFEGFDFTRVGQHTVFSDPGLPGVVVRHARFLDGREGPVKQENAAYVHGRGDGAPESRHRFLVQDSDFGPYEMWSYGAYAVTLFDAGDSLIENNQVHLGATTGGFHDKDNSQRNTYRENYVEFTPADATPFGIFVSGQHGVDKVHVHHNLIINSGVGVGGQCLTEGCSIRDVNIHNNTMVNGGIRLAWGVFNPDSFGTRVIANILSSGSLPPYLWWSCLNSVPSALSTQLYSERNRIETAAALAIYDGECSGSAVNIPWSQWQNTHNLDTVASGSVVSATSALVGQGIQAGLQQGDPRRPALGHLYLSSAAIFANGFE